MSPAPDRKRAQLDRLRQQRKQYREDLARVMSLLSKADARRKSETRDQRKWNTVLDNLEKSLDETRARLTVCDTRIEFLERELKGSPADTPPPLSRAPEMDEFDGLEGLPALTENSLAVAKKILTMPVEDIGQLSIEETALLYSHITDESVDGASPSVERLLGRIEVANQTAPEAAQVEKERQPQERRQAVLRAAVDKISAGRLDDMSAEEVRLTVATYNLLERRVTSSPRDKRLKRILGASAKILMRRQAKARKPSK